MKKFLALFAVASLVLAGCGSSSDSSNKDNQKAQIVMITDKGTIEDKSFNQGTWEGIQKFAKENDKVAKYIQPTDGTTQAYSEAIDQAVNDYKADVVVTPGFLFEQSIYEKQTQYPDVKFILVDGVPNDGKSDNATYKTAKNTVSIKYAEEQSGYLAGYAAVKDGNTKLGFMGGIAVPAVVNFGYGFVQGAQDAAKELGIKIDMKYKYTNSFTATPEIQSEAASWYKGGTEVIFSCGGGIFASINSAALATDKAQVIGVDVDQNSESDRVLTSAYKQLANSVNSQLKAIYDNTFKGGENLVLGAKDDAVGLPMTTSRFKTFTSGDYDKLFKEIVDGNVTIKNNEAEGISDPTKLVNDSVNLEYLK